MNCPQITITGESMNYRASIVGLMVFSLLVSVDLIFGQSIGDAQKSCGQTREVRDPLINEAIGDVFTVRRVSFVGKLTLAIATSGRESERLTKEITLLRTFSKPA